MFDFFGINYWRQIIEKVLITLLCLKVKAEIMGLHWCILRGTFVVSYLTHFLSSVFNKELNWPQKILITVEAKRGAPISIIL